MFSAWRSWSFRRKALVITTGASLIGLVWLWFWLRPNGLAFTGDLSAYATERKGALIDVRTDAVTEPGHGFLWTSRVLSSSSGLEVEILIREPDPPFREPPPLAIMIGGFRTGRDAVRYVADPGKTLLVGVSYPFEGDRSLDGLGYVAALRDLRLSMHDTPPALMLTLDHMYARGGFDPDRVELIGISLGSILVCVTGALDPRVTRVWSIHGGAGLYDLFDAVLDKAVPNDKLRHPLASFGNHLVQRLDPADYVDRIAPRELVAINGTRDRAIPRAAAARLYEAAREPKEMIWLDTEHVHPSQEDLIAELLELVTGRISATAD